MAIDFIHMETAMNGMGPPQLDSHLAQLIRWSSSTCASSCACWGYSSYLGHLRPSLGGMFGCISIDTTAMTYRRDARSGGGALKDIVGEAAEVLSTTAGARSAPSWRLHFYSSSTLSMALARCSCPFPRHALAQPCGDLTAMIDMLVTSVRYGATMPCRSR